MWGFCGCVVVVGWGKEEICIIEGRYYSWDFSMILKCLFNVFVNRLIKSSIDVVFKLVLW